MQGGTSLMRLNQSQRIKGALNLAEQSFRGLQDVVHKFLGKSLAEDCDELQEVNRHLEQLQDDLIKLVHLDNSQLHHPYVRHYLLSWPNSKDLLYSLHRGLEVGVKRQIAEWELPIVVALQEADDAVKRDSLRRIQRNLIDAGAIKSRQ